MSDQSNGAMKRLTLEDPVPPETFAALQQIQDAQVNIAMEMLHIEKRKVQLLAADKKLTDQNSRLFQAILVERGLPPTTVVELDARTGKVLVKDKPAPDDPERMA